MKDFGDKQVLKDYSLEVYSYSDIYEFFSGIFQQLYDIIYETIPSKRINAQLYQAKNIQ